MRGRVRRIDVVSAVVAVLAAVLTTALGAKPGTSVDPAVVLAFVAGVAVAFVRGRPGLVLSVQLFVVVCNGFLLSLSPVLLLLPLITLGVLAYRSRGLAVVLSWLAVFAMLLVLVWVIGPLGADGMLLTVGAAGLAAAPVASGWYIRGVRRATQVADERAAEAQLWRDVEMRAARQGERSRLARDLHDIVAHHVGAMTLRASSAKLAMDLAGDPEVAAAALADVAATGRQVLDELRGLLAVLQDPDAIDSDPLMTEPKAAIADAVDRVRAAGVPVAVDFDPRFGDQSLVVRATVARIAQEALINVLKHAGPGTATRLVVTVGPADLLELRVDNDAPAGEAAPSALPTSGHGLAGMRDRVALLGGHLVAGPLAGGGWSVTAVIRTVPGQAELTALPAGEVRA